MKKAISAKIDEDVLQYCKEYGGKLNTLINDLLRGWKQKNEEKQLVAFQVETGQDKLNQMKNNNFKCSQSCMNCIYMNNTNECKKKIRQTWGKNFCCIYWEKKKGSK